MAAGFLQFFARVTRREARGEAPTPAQWEEPILKHEFEGHEKDIWSFVFLQDNVHIVSSSEDGTMRKWNCDTGLVVGEPWKCEGGDVYALALSPDGKMIACGRGDGSVQRWNTDGEMIEGVWPGHSEAVRSLSWSPSGSRIASGSYDGTILIREAESGQVEVGPIKTEQTGVYALAYSPSGDRIASGGYDVTICIWDTKTGERVVGPIENLGTYVTSLVWSSDSTKLYSASDRFARVFDSKTGKVLHHFEHHSPLWSVALSPKNIVLACAGDNVVRLWDTESYQPLGQPLHTDLKILRCVWFSQDGRYVAYGGNDKKLTLWMVKDIVPQLPAPIPHQQIDRQSRSSSPLPSCLDADATGGGGFIEDTHDDPYNNFFQSSQQSLPSPFHLSPLFSARRLWNAISRHRPPPDQFVPRQRSRRGFFSRRARSKSSLELATMKPDQPVPEAKVGEGEGERGDNVDDCASAHNSLNPTEDKGKQRDDDAADDARSPPSDNPTPLINLDSADNRNIWAKLMRRQGKNSTSVKIVPTIKRPEVVEVSAVRGFQRLVVMKRKGKTKLPEATCNIPLVALNTSDSSSVGQLSQAFGAPLAAAHVGGSSQLLSPHAVPVQAAIGRPHASPSHFVTNHHTIYDLDSRSIIEGSCNRFLDRICFPCGHYHEDS